MEIIRTKKEFENIYPYDKQYLKKKDYPKRYPCICWVEEESWSDHGGGITEEVNIIYPPTTADLNSFFLGCKAAHKD